MMMPTRHPRPFPPRPTAARARRARARRAGFTLVELLVVIAIIVLLISILLPTIGKVRLSAQGAKTQASMASIASAIERYHGDHRAYPGVISNGLIANGYKPPGAGGQNLTMTENLVLTLCGGYTYREKSAGVPDDPDVDLKQIGKGPLDLSPVPMKRVRRAPYIEASPGNLFALTYNPNAPASGSMYAPENSAEMAGIHPPLSNRNPAPDSNVPEFVDGFSDARPIIYLRANVGTPDSTSGPPAVLNYENETVQYNSAHLYRYERGAAGDFKGDFTWGVNPEDYQDVRKYLQHPNIANTPRGKDKFMLISAGRDRRYGTTDDIFMGG